MDIITKIEIYQYQLSYHISTHYIRYIKLKTKTWQNAPHAMMHAHIIDCAHDLFCQNYGSFKKKKKKKEEDGILV